MAFTKATGLSRFIDIPWPKGLGAQARFYGSRPGDKALPRADVLVVTWTVDEGHALSRVLTPGQGFARRLRALHAQFRDALAAT